MIKYFHELTKEEFELIVATKQCTWEKLAEDYPQPKWCVYPNAIFGDMGCWGLLKHCVDSDAKYCRNCEFNVNKADVEC